MQKKVVRNETLKLNVHKSCGPDKIHPKILIELVDFVCRTLVLLVNKPMDEGCIPQYWKIAYVSPIFKKGAGCEAENYRPISLTSTLCKLMESFVKDSIMTYMRAENCELSRVVDTIYFDFVKAFDNVPHERLLDKLKSYGINGKALEQIKTFLSNRH